MIGHFLLTASLALALFPAAQGDDTFFQAHLITNWGFRENSSVLVPNSFLCSIYTKLNGFNAFMMNYTSGICSIGDLKSVATYSSSGIKVFAETEPTDGKI